MSLLAPPVKVPSKLAIYRTLSPLSGVHVSPICLGAMSVGDKWNAAMGSMDKEKSFELLDAYFEMGGNFIDTANNYQDETSEMYIGEWAEARGIRNQLVIATKYTTNYKRGDTSIATKANYVGNSAKNLYVSVHESLKKLCTDYIDILYVHWWEFETSVKEVMDALHTLVVQGKVLYLGISDAPAWIVSQANQYAQCMGKTPFCIYQGKWNVLDRSFERDIIPMARSLGLALAPWQVVGGGKLRTDEEEARRRETGEKGRTVQGPWERTEDEVKMSHALENVANELGAKSITSVAIAYVMQKAPYVFPIIGGRKVEHLKANMEALDLTLTPEHIKYLESIIPFNPGFPHDMIGDGTVNSFMTNSAMKLQRLPLPQPLRPVDLQ
ncbi:putative aryl-alcohol dehydrogenase aad14 [Stygiomarasmius scandens]|uniref:Aryl-alcohol dehydrogenase aad14 n=1 Tax=Marasmiellus scandens TaxID=2682957 RepID=A0ABR1J5H0_9AGAR